MLHVSRYTQGCELVAMFDDVTDSGNVTFVCDDGGQTDARKWSRELTSPARGVHTPALLPSTVVSASHCPAQISLYSEDARLTSSSIPCDQGRWLSCFSSLSQDGSLWCQDCDRINIIYIYIVCTCAVMVTNPLLLGCFYEQWQHLAFLVHGEHWTCNYSASVVEV